MLIKRAVTIHIIIIDTTTTTNNNNNNCCSPAALESEIPAKRERKLTRQRPKCPKPVCFAVYICVGFLIKIP